MSSTQIIVKIHNAGETLASHVVNVFHLDTASVKKVTHIQAQSDVNYELIKKSSGYAPENIATKRVGKDLHIAFEGENIDNPDLIIDEYYEYDEEVIVGLAENGQYYDYVPESTLLSDAVSVLSDGSSAGQALGGESHTTAFWLSGTAFPLWGILGGVAVAAGVVALAMGGGGSKDVTTQPVNHKPNATDDKIVIDEDTPISNINVLGNDTDPDGDALTVIAATSPNGLVSINPDGTLNFSPTLNFDGETIISYILSDDKGETQAGTVIVTVKPINDAPIISGDTSGTGSEDNGVIIGTLSATDADGIKDNTYYTVTSTTMHGTASIDPQTGAWQYTPVADYSGNDSFVVTIIDDKNNSTTQEINITVAPVDDVPTAIASTSEGEEDAPTIPVTLSGIDIDGTIVSVTVTALPSLMQGTLYYSDKTNLVKINTPLTPDDAASLVFVPTKDFVGTVIITFTAEGNNGLISNPANEVITVIPANDAPINTVPVAQTTNEDTAKVITGLSISDVDAGTGSMTVTLGVTNGTLSVTGGTATISGSETGTVTLTGTVVQINATLSASNAVTYNPTVNFNGDATLSITTNDNSNTGGGALSDNDTVAITVSPVNDNFLDDGESVTINEDTPQSGNVIGTSTSLDGPITVTAFSIAGDSTIYNAGQTVTIVDKGTLKLEVNGAYSFTPTLNYIGDVPVITYTLTDGSGTNETSALTITINPVNDAPINTVLVAQTTNEDTAKIITGLSISDVDAGTGSVMVTLAVTNGTLSVTSGTTTINGSGTNTVTIKGTVAQINATLSASNAVTYNPMANFSGEATLKMTTDDKGNTGSGGVLSDSDSVAITVAPVVDTPTLSVVKTAQSLVFVNSWESVSNEVQRTPDLMSGFAFEGWSLVSAGERAIGGTNVFEIWNTGDYINEGGVDRFLVAAAGNGEDFIELNDVTGSGVAQTIGIERSVLTTKGLIYDLSFDAAGALGVAGDYTKIGLYVDGVLKQSYTFTSPQDSIDWKSIEYRFEGDGNSHTIQIRTDASVFHTDGRGAYVDDMSLNTFQGVLAGNKNSNTTQIALNTYIDTALTDTDGSEKLSIILSGVPSGAKVVTDMGTYAESGGSITFSGTLSSAMLEFGSSFTGNINIGVIVKATESSNNATNSTALETFTLAVVSTAFSTSDMILSEAVVTYSGNNTVNDSATGSDNGVDFMIGLGGNDTLYGWDNNDYLKGGDGDDMLLGDSSTVATGGGNGNDTLDGGAGNDTLTGGDGYDIFVFGSLDGTANGGNGLDTITDFSTNKNTQLDTNEDTLNLSGIFSDSGVTIDLSNVTDYLHMNGTTLQIDRDGAGAGFALTNLVTLTGTTITDADFANLITSGQFVL